MAETIQGTAVIVQSKREPHLHENAIDEHGSRAGREGLEDVLITGVVGTPYAFVLDVTVPGHDPYQVSVETRVPVKAEKVSMFKSHPIPLTLEVPVVVNAGDPDKVSIDWKAFLALPDRVPRLKAARERALSIQGQRNAAAQPEQYAAQRAQNKGVVMNWAELVRAGKLTKAELERDAGRLVQIGLMDPADLEAALARVDEA